MRVQVPNSVNVKRLVSDLDLSPTCSESLKNKMYYFLSRIVSTNENFHLNEKTDGFRKISSVYMRKVMGRKGYYLVLDLLLNREDPIIESDNSWQSSQRGAHKGYSKGYRLTQKYNTGEICYKSLPRKFGDRVQKHTKGISQPKADVDYQFLLDQFESHKFTFLPSVYDYIQNFGNALLSRVENNNEYQRKVVLNKIGYWLYEAEMIQEEDPWRSVSPKNHRIHSWLTNLNSNFRPFLLCDGEPLGMFDITASQLYMLSTISSDMFLNGSGNGYNLQTIYPEIIDELVSYGIIMRMDSTYTENCFEFSSTLTGGTSSYVCNNTGGCSEESQTFPSPFMWGPFLEVDDKVSRDKYRQAPFEMDFYKDLIHKSQSVPGNIEEITDEQRQGLKNNMMHVLFQDNQNHRNNEENILMFNKIYPGVDKWINQMHASIGKSKFSHLLQRAESYLVLNVVSRQFHIEYPSAPIFTIHDAILTYEKHLPDLHRLIVERFYDITGVRVGAKPKSKKPNPEPKMEDVDEVWGVIKPIRNQKKFDDVRHGVFITNIKRGTEFLGRPIF
jgi:hypothetical protein